MNNPQLAAAYAECRGIARRRARNFYWSFIALPAHKRDAICAVYAFMRQADDLADDDSRSIEDRRAAMQSWMAAWRLASEGAPTTDPVHLALRDTAQRFAIPMSLLDELVEGTAMDLREDGSDSTTTFATFDDLYRYCYLVASVVGLVCIRIFGYTDTRAEQLAEQTGIAFQLTNILRDVREDAAMRRIYLPLDDMERHGITAEQLFALAASGERPPAQMQALLAMEAARAEQYYRAAVELMPLLDKDSRPALWVLVTIYKRLLQRIQQSGYAVFSGRISVPAHEKMGILLRGIWKTWSSAK